MPRIVSGVLLAVVTLVGTPAVAPVLSSSVVYAEVSDEQLMDQVLKIKRMLADLEESLEAKKMPTDATRREKMMPMLNEIERILKEARPGTPHCCSAPAGWLGRSVGWRWAAPRNLNPSRISAVAAPPLPRVLDNARGPARRGPPASQRADQGPCHTNGRRESALGR